MSDTQAVKKNDQKNALSDLLINIVAPSLILMKLSSEDRLGPTSAFAIAVSLPLLYGLFDWFKKKKLNLFAGLGLVNVALTGGLGMLKVEGIWFAAKEALVPFILGCAVLASLKTRFPLVRTMLLNESVINLPLVQTKLRESNSEEAFEKLMTKATLLLSASFFLSSILNFALARFILQSPSGTPEFNAELGKMTALSFPVIAVPSLVVSGIAIWRLLAGLKALTGLDFESLFHAQAGKSERNQD